MFLVSYFGFLLWNLMTTWWIYNSSAFGALFAFLFNSSFYALLFSLYRWSHIRLKKLNSSIFLVGLWISFEKFHLNWDFSWPWLNLGNAFSDHIYWIQWYEFTGVFGGSLWVLLINFGFLKIYQFYLKEREIKTAIKKSIPLLLGIGIPIAFSLILFIKQKEPTKKVEVIVLQPNIDPYNEKYQFSNISLLDRVELLTKGKLTQNTDYLLTPESYFDEGLGIDLKGYEYTPFRREIDSFLTKYPKLTFLNGIQSYRYYPNLKNPPSSSSNKIPSGWIDLYNSAIQFESSSVDQIYHKSKLVVGVEYMPYKSLLEPIIGPFLLDLGGTIASRGTQQNRSVFVNNNGVKTAPIICYESIYGEFVTEYNRKGAQFLSIITNDAWWGNTQGHKQLLSYARLRAIENRREVARSANTGISAFINSKGEIVQKLQYDEEGSLRAMVGVSDKITFYTTYGDYIARICFFLLILQVAFAIRSRKLS